MSMIAIDNTSYEPTRVTFAYKLNTTKKPFI